VHIHARKAYRGSRGITPLIRNLGTRWRQIKGAVHNIFVCSLPGPQYDAVTLSFYKKARVLTIR
jgi:hypothetical protein